MAMAVAAVVRPAVTQALAHLGVPTLDGEALGTHADGAVDAVVVVLASNVLLLLLRGTLCLGLDRHRDLFQGVVRLVELPVVVVPASVVAMVVLAFN